MQYEKPYFPILESEMAKHGIKKKEMAEHLGISDRTFLSKINGETDLWWNEVLKIHSIFPDVPAEKLFSHTPDTSSNA